MTCLRIVALIVPMGFAGVGCATASDLERNPFASPFALSGSERPNAMTVRSRGTSPAVRGILVADGRSLVNLNGKIIGVGDEVDGYRLLHVAQEYAVFQRGDDVVKMSLYPDENDE